MFGNVTQPILNQRTGVDHRSLQFLKSEIRSVLGSFLVPTIMISFPISSIIPRCSSKTKWRRYRGVSLVQEIYGILLFEYLQGIRYHLSNQNNLLPFGDTSKFVRLLHWTTRRNFQVEPMRPRGPHQSVCIPSFW